jgi:hypothetical protein
MIDKNYFGNPLNLRKYLEHFEKKVLNFNSGNVLDIRPTSKNILEILLYDSIIPRYLILAQTPTRLDLTALFQVSPWV